MQNIQNISKSKIGYVLMLDTSNRVILEVCNILACKYEDGNIFEQVFSEESANVTSSNCMDWTQTHSGKDACSQSDEVLKKFIQVWKQDNMLSVCPLGPTESHGYLYILTNFLGYEVTIGFKFSGK